MGASPIRKRNTIRIIKPSRQSKKNISILNQPTLVGTILKLMDDEKVVVALIRHEKANKMIILLPIAFKVKKDQIPCDLRLLELHTNNFVIVELQGVRRFAAMIVSVGDDSKEVLEIYNSFVVNIQPKVKQPIEKVITSWLNVDNITLSRFKATKLPIVTESDLNKINRKMDMYSKKADRSEHRRSIRNITKDLNEPGTSTGSVDTSISNETPKATPSKEKQSNPESPTAMENRKNMNECLKRLRRLTDALVELPDVKNIFDEVLNVLEKILFSKNLQDLFLMDSNEKINPYEEIRVVPKNNKTHEVGIITLVEGILPFYTTDYEDAIATAEAGEAKDKSINLVNALVKVAFPQHWIVGVTLRGSGGRTALTSIWNHKNPLSNPCEGSYKKDLGESRLRALIDHCYRKQGKLEYNKSDEKSVVLALGKALCYVRNAKYKGSTISTRPKSLAEHVEVDDELEDDSAFKSFAYPSAQSSRANSFDEELSEPVAEKDSFTANINFHSGLTTQIEFLDGSGNDEKDETGSENDELEEEEVIFQVRGSDDEVSSELDISLEKNQQEVPETRKNQNSPAREIERNETNNEGICANQDFNNGNTIEKIIAEVTPVPEFDFNDAKDTEAMVDDTTNDDTESGVGSSVSEKDHNSRFYTSTQKKRIFQGNQENDATSAKRSLIIEGSGYEVQSEVGAKASTSTEKDQSASFSEFLANLSDSQRLALQAALQSQRR